MWETAIYVSRDIICLIFNETINTSQRQNIKYIQPSATLSSLLTKLHRPSLLMPTSTGSLSTLPYLKSSSANSFTLRASPSVILPPASSGLAFFFRFRLVLPIIMSSSYISAKGCNWRRHVSFQTVQKHRSKTWAYSYTNHHPTPQLVYPQASSSCFWISLARIRNSWHTSQTETLAIPNGAGTMVQYSWLGLPSPSRYHSKGFGQSMCFCILPSCSWPETRTICRWQMVYLPPAKTKTPHISQSKTTQILRPSSIKWDTPEVKKAYLPTCSPHTPAFYKSNIVEKRTCLSFPFLSFPFIPNQSIIPTIHPIHWEQIKSHEWKSTNRRINKQAEK